MDEQRWSRVRELFHAAHDVEPVARPGLLAELAAGDEGLCREVEDLLASTTSADEWFAGLAARMGTPALGEVEADLSGRLIGNYRILALLGRGGMGAVYLAERADAQFEKTVALKLLPLGMAGTADRQRFLRERQVLARLEHPGIARLLDGGVTDDGTPFFVMECVQGTQITDYCDARSLSVSARFELFLQVCSAVEYAHRNLVIHRDLKPANILVTDDGCVKLLDFGIARVVDEHDAEHGTTTALYGRRLTPGYASPEQVRNQPVATTTDVYSLGVILYDLLTGRPPYRVTADLSAAEIEAVICEQVPRPPSRVVQREPERLGEVSSAGEAGADDVAHARGVTVARLGRQLQGDVDAIVLTALRKEPAQRYQSVAALADDIRRHFRGLPVRARNHDRWYRTARFLARNRLAVAAGALLALMLFAIAGLSVRHAVLTAAQAQALAQQRDRARQQAARAERVTGILTGLFQSTDPAEQRGDTLNAGALLARGLVRVQSELRDEPQVRAELLHAIGEAYHNLGLFDSATAVLTEAVLTRRRLGAGARAGLAESLVSLADTRRRAWAFAAADSLYREALAIQSQLIAAAPGDTTLLLSRAETLTGHATALRNLDRADSAVLLVRRAVQTFTRLRGPDDAGTLTARAELAYNLRGTGALDEAEAIYRDVARRQRALGDAARVQLGSTLNNLGYLLRTRGDLAAADTAYRESSLINGQLLGEAHPTTLLVQQNRAGVLFELGRLDEAEAIFRRRVELERSHRPAGHWRIGAALGALGSFLLRGRENAEAALGPLREQLAIYRPALGDGNSWTAQARIMLGECLVQLRRYGDAEPLLLAGLAGLERRDAPATAWTGRARTALVQLYEAWGRPARARIYRERSIAPARK